MAPPSFGIDVKKPNVPLRSALGRALAELAVIVAGVLIALAAQSWWEGRDEAEERVQALRALHADLGLLRAQLVRDSTMSADIEKALLTVIRGDDLGALTDSAYITTVARAVWYYPADSDIDYPAYRDLEGSGRLGLLPDGIRLALVDYMQRIRISRVFYADVKQIQTEFVDPWVVEEFDADRLVWSPEVGYDFPGLPDAAPLGTREGRNRATIKYWSTRELSRELSLLLARTDSMDARLKALGTGN